MKFRIKQLQNRITHRFLEKYHVFRKKFKKTWDGYVEKGHERMTIMFIPHNEKKIFNFQISKFTILFFMVLFVIIIITSSYAFIKNAAIKREERRLLLTYNDISSQLLLFEKHTNAVSDEIKNLKPEIEELYELASGNDDIENLWQARDFDVESINELNKLRNILPDEIFMIKQIQKDLFCTTKTVKTIKNFIDVRSKVIRDTPTVIPNEGHITSLFGWRRSPFGFGRDFHGGIDIAASPGTAIRATAPGKVSSVGYSGGYGLTIRIQHKYGFETVYGHCIDGVVGGGQDVVKGQVIGHVGQTGNATGPHCHYEIRLGGIPINPYPYMSGAW